MGLRGKMYDWLCTETYDLYARKHDIVEMRGDVTDAGQTKKQLTENAIQPITRYSANRSWRLSLAIGASQNWASLKQNTLLYSLRFWFTPKKGQMLGQAIYIWSTQRTPISDTKPAFVSVQPEYLATCLLKYLPQFLIATKRLLQRTRKIGLLTTQKNFKINHWFDGIKTFESEN